MTQEAIQITETPPLPGLKLVQDLNKALQALGTDFAGPDDPAALAGPFMTWADTGNMLLKRRNEANTEWIVERGLFDTPTNQNVLSLNGGQLAGLRNKIINGAFRVNERAYVSGTATTAGQYTLDRWKVSTTAGITYSASAQDRTVTIPSGQTLTQVVESYDVPPGEYVLSWEGTAQGRIGDSGAFASSGVTKTLAGFADTPVQFTNGTLKNVQLEQGVIATPFETLPVHLTSALCKRYFERVSMQTIYGWTYSANGDTRTGMLSYTDKRTASPTITPATIALSLFVVGDNGSNVNLNGDVSSPVTNQTGVAWTTQGNYASIAGAVGNSFVYSWIARPQTSVFIDAEI
ncbi:hypothetical protein PT7_P038 (plasmid) [Pusillimonas sp. T7-7]|uniref:hypothetical protein n=1 Tax=Pusillimonas sp. (strain T7-7) TaxID=1007105 RepID=UPI0002084A9D|nr:hypothetical protein [Pusillimonas sp. T7-7]AEC22274.1 hypothetical protein PT7_P038 [Pusillimonas sp. T7-7]